MTRARPTLLLSMLLVMACGRQPEPEWAIGRLPGACQLLSAPDERTLEPPVTFTLSRQPGVSGVSVLIDRFGSGAPGTPVSGALLRIDGEAIRAEATRVTSNTGPGVHFSFDPKRILRRSQSPRIQLLEYDQSVFDVRLRDMRPHFDALLQCDRQLLLAPDPS
jgi:hypothetical protein